MAEGERQFDSSQVPVMNGTCDEMLRVLSMIEKHLSDGGGGGNYGPMEARVAKLEAHVEHIQSDVRTIKEDLKGLRTDARTDFRLLFGSLIAVAVGLAGLMAKGFHWL